MSYIISVETSLNTCSVAVFQNENIISFLKDERKNIHGIMISVLADEVIKQAKISVKNLDAISVSIGPGSYTGLRVGVSFTKGLAAALNIPVIAVDTTYIIAENCIEKIVNNEEYFIASMIDARRDEIFLAVYNEKLECIENPQPALLSAELFSAYSHKKLYIAGNGAEKYFNSEFRKNNVEMIEQIEPLACYMNKISCKKFNDKLFENTDLFEPLYTKEFHGKMV